MRLCCGGFRLILFARVIVKGCDVQTEDMNELLELCNSDDPIERFEAFEELWERALHQGTPTADSSSIFQLLLNWIGNGHPDWVDILDGIFMSGLDLAE